jgi:TolA-binding protein
MIHINGFSAGSAMCGAGLAGDGSFRKFKIQSFVGFSGGFSGPMRANSDKAKETKVRIYNGTGDLGHVEPSKSMYKAFKDAGYDAEHIEVPGQGHSYPLTDHRKIMTWYVSLDKVSRKKGEYMKLASEAEKELKDKDYAKAQKLFEKLQKAVGDELPELAKKAKEGLDAIKKAQEEAIQKIDELKAAGDNDKLEEYCKQVAKDFAKTDAADKAKETLKEISRSSKPTTKKPEKKKPETAPKKDEPQEGTAATLLAKAKRYVAARAYEVAQKALKEIISKYPDSPEAKEAEKLLEEVESEM